MNRITYVVVMAFLLALSLGSCKQEVKEQITPHEALSPERWRRFVQKTGATSLGIGCDRIHLEGKAASDVVALLGEPTRKLREESETLPVRYPHLSTPFEVPPFNERWVYSGLACDLVVYFSKGKVVLALYQYMDY